MRNHKSLVRAVGAVVAAAACAVALDAAVLFAANGSGTTRPATQPVAVAPSTQPVLVGGPTISSDYAQPNSVAQRRPTLTASPASGTGADVPATVSVGGGVNPGQPAPAAMSSNTSTAAPATTRPVPR